MFTPADVIDSVAALQNDAAQDNYTDSACLPYLNMALRDLQRIYELNDIPVTHESSHTITIKSGITKIGFSTNPPLPQDLVEIVQLWESLSGQDDWIPVDKKTFIPHYLQTADQATTLFGIWAWFDNAIHVPYSNQDNDLKIDYIKSLFNKITNVNIAFDPKFTNIQTYLEFRTAALCSMYIGENETRALALQTDAEKALNEALGISVKGQQSIAIRRRPFRLAWKSRSRSF